MGELKMDKWVCPNCHDKVDVSPDEYVEIGVPYCADCDRERERMEWFDKYGWLQQDLPDECVSDCSAQGTVDDAVEYWTTELEFTVPRKLAIDWLAEFGAWPLKSNKYDQGLNDMTDRQLAEKVLWLGCCDQKDGQYEDDREGGHDEPYKWLGLVH